MSVSSVTYGRIVYFAVTSNFSSEELRAALDFGFSGAVVDVNGSVSLTNTEILSESQITAFILGGNGDIAVQAINGVNDAQHVPRVGPQSGEIGSGIIPAVPQPGNKFTISINLREADAFPNGDDSFGDHEIDIEFEDGWRENDFVYSLADGDQQLEAHFSFSPVP